MKTQRSHSPRSKVHSKRSRLSTIKDLEHRVKDLELLVEQLIKNVNQLTDAYTFYPNPRPIPIHPWHPTIPGWNERPPPGLRRVIKSVMPYKRNPRLLHVGELPGNLGYIYTDDKGAHNGA